MPAFRQLLHGQAGATENAQLEPGAWQDVPLMGQFLLDAEFLSKSAPSAAGTASCIYAKCPPYLESLGLLFPWVYFFAYERPRDSPEYDPEQPALQTVQVRGNITTTTQVLSRDIAGVLGQAERKKGLLLICHGLAPYRQANLCVSLRPSSALLDISGLIEAEYMAGEIILPIYLPPSRLFACLTVNGQQSRAYDPALYQNEMGEIAS